MKLYAKIIIYAVLVFSMAILFSGYLLITYSYENAISREIDRALNQYQYDKFTVQAEMITNTELFQKGISQNDIILRRLSADLSGQTAFFSEDQTLLFSELPVQTDFSIINMVSNEVIIHQFQTVNDKSYLMICGKLTQSGISIYLLIATDISSVITQRKMMVQSFVQVYFITLALSIVLIMILSAFLTKPINRMTKIANRISSGHYHERLSISRGDEIGELAKSFNDMADAVEDKINELSENSRQKEEFVASFAHELKTPLTSIIGYSDMLYQKNLPPEDIKNAAWYILSE